MVMGRPHPAETVSKPSEQSARSALAFMNDHLGECLRLPDIADHLGYSPFHFSRQFRAATGIPPGEFLTALRFQRAKQLLLDDDSAVVDICTRVGFTSLATFTRRFHQWVGVTPAAPRTVASAVSERPTTPFSLGDPRTSRVDVTIEVADHGMLQPPLVWLGWYSRPVPIGLPAAGMVRYGGGVVHLPLAPGHPWLMAFTVPRDADVGDHLAPAAPVVAAHPSPIIAACRVKLTCRPASALGVPMLSALPALHPIQGAGPERITSRRG